MAPQDWKALGAEDRGEGAVEHGRVVHLRIARMVGPGSVYEIPLGRLGAHNFYLRVHILVDDRIAG